MEVYFSVSFFFSYPSTNKMEQSPVTGAPGKPYHLEDRGCKALHYSLNLIGATAQKQNLHSIKTLEEWNAELFS